ncbi:MAG: 4-alpha-glucanotransferase [Erythrobacter sp.]|nr:MAG: 4-alpha-glucanotransferase [Erythrobacter sp.]
MEPLHALAAAAGLQRHWRDVDGREHVVADATLVSVLGALGFKAANKRQIARSLALIEAEHYRLAALVVAEAGEAIALPFTCGEALVRRWDGAEKTLDCQDGVPIAPSEPGYYDCRIDGVETRLAVAPQGFPQPPSEPRPWGVSLQIPSLRGSRPSPFGTFGELAENIEALAAAGADMVAINPVHALAPGHGERFSPYFPSSRRFVNGAMADPALLGLSPLPEEDGPELIGWERALPARLHQLRTLYEDLDAEKRAEITGIPDGGMLRHAIFDALDCHFRARSGAWSWREWPSRYHKPEGRAVASFAAKHAAEVDFHLFVQGLAQKCLAEVQARAKAAGMRVGLVSDLAVGVDPGGADCWALGADMLHGLTIGAPPDPLGPQGQNWGITGFSPSGLRRNGYAPWIAMIRSALAHGGGLRVDHAFGLARLWVIPEGGGAADGVYLAYPFDDLARLLALEAHLADAFVIAEDLGTSPHGFADTIGERGILGMRVLWFERAEDQGFIGAADYDPQAVAMTGTHDTPTLAGWWSGHDLDWAEQLGRLPLGMDRAQAEAIRDWDRGLLWSTIAGQIPRPAPHEPSAVVTAAIAHIARTPCALAVVPAEDLLGVIEQPNIPGTVTEHPNWRRRLAAPLGELLASDEVRQRIDALHGEPPLSP